MQTIDYIKRQIERGLTLEGALLSLKDAVGINSKRYLEEGLVVLNYDQINSPKTDPLVMECRGVILDTESLEVVARPFDRFFNYGEALSITSTFLFDDSEIYEKADGSLVKVYFWKDSWHVATRGTAFAETENYTGSKFEDLILKAFGLKSKHDFSVIMDYCFSREITYVFEYTSPDNRIVTPYSEDSMVMLGARMNSDGREIPYSQLENAVNALRKEHPVNLRMAEVYQFRNMDSMLKFSKDMEGLKEGFVCRDKTGLRIKVKSPKYVAVHRVRGEAQLTPKRIAELVVTNEADEYLLYFPEDSDKVAPVQDLLQTFYEEMSGKFKEVNLITSQKLFAMSIKELCYAGLFFTARRMEVSPVEEFSELPVNKKLKVFMQWMKGQ